MDGNVTLSGLWFAVCCSYRRAVFARELRAVLACDCVHTAAAAAAAAGHPPAAPAGLCQESLVCVGVRVLLLVRRTTRDGRRADYLGIS